MHLKCLWTLQDALSRTRARALSLSYLHTNIYIRTKKEGTTAASTGAAAAKKLSAPPMARYENAAKYT